jgi:hypothetical protein
MTSDDRRKQERRFDDERCIDALLAEGGFPDDAELRAVLLQLRELRVTEVPEPSPEVAALMSRPAEADVVRLDDWSRRHPRKKRAVFTTLAVAASLGVAGGAAAANETLRSQAEGTISSIIRSFSPPVPGTPEPTSTTPPASPPSASLPPEAPQPLPAVVGSPAGTPPAAAVPAAPAPAQNRAVEPSVRERQAVEARKHVTQAPQNRGTGTPATVPLSKGQPANPGASRPAEVPSRADKPEAGRADVPAGGKAKGKADADGGTGQGAGQPKVAPTQARR